MASAQVSATEAIPVAGVMSPNAGAVTSGTGVRSLRAGAVSPRPEAESSRTRLARTRTPRTSLHGMHLLPALVIGLGIYGGAVWLSPERTPEYRSSTVGAQQESLVAPNHHQSWLLIYGGLKLSELTCYWQTRVMGYLSLLTTLCAIRVRSVAAGAVTAVGLDAEDVANPLGTRPAVSRGIEDSGTPSPHTTSRQDLESLVLDLQSQVAQQREKIGRLTMIADTAKDEVRLLTVRMDQLEQQERGGGTDPPEGEPTPPQLGPRGAPSKPVATPQTSMPRTQEASLQDTFLQLEDDPLMRWYSSPGTPGLDSAAANSSLPQAAPGLESLSPLGGPHCFQPWGWRWPPRHQALSSRRQE